MMIDDTNSMNGGADDTAGKQRGRPFRPGESGNPAGRPKGARVKLGEAFVAAILADFEQHGAATIAKVREERPDQYIKVIASILPKQVDLDDYTTEALADLIIARRKALASRMH